MKLPRSLSLLTSLCVVGLLTTHTTSAENFNPADFYQQTCVACHGEKADGKGALGLNASDLHKSLQNSDNVETQIDIILNGKNAMPAWKAMLNRDQAGELMAYISQLR